MPHISQSMLDCTIYLYHSIEDAERGAHSGGSGFLVGYLPKGGYARYPHVYAVTNYHVAVSGGASAVRLKGRDGNSRYFEFDPSEWKFIARDDGGSDLAVIHMPFTDEEKEKYSCLRSDMFVTKEAIRSEDLGVGDDVFMIGRFVDLDGGITNEPAARFGNISVMPTLIALEDWPKRDLYCVDMHSRSGYSGSPVIAYRTFGQDLTELNVTQNIQHDVSGRWIRLKYRNYMGLLGVHVGQFPETFTGLFYEEDNDAPQEVEIIGVSGMTAVIPAWKITELLELPEFEKQRQEFDSSKDEVRKRAHRVLARMESKLFRPHTEIVRAPRNSARTR